MTDFSSEALSDFLDRLASDAPTPGGGTAAAVAAGMGAALAEMVAALTLSREKYAASHEAVRPIAEEARKARARFRSLADEDARAYDGVVSARRLPKETEEQKDERSRRIAAANRDAAEVPMRTARTALDLLRHLPELAEKANPNAASDAGSSALLLDAAIGAALLNVGINLAGISDADFVGRMQRETADAQEEAQRLRDRVLAAVRRTF